MNIIKSENVWVVDVDETLIQHKSGTLRIQCPLLKTYSSFTPCEGNITLLKEKFVRGCYIVVWSQGGFAWAETVVNALQLNEYVHTIMSKPVGYIDDKEIDEWFPKRVYIKPETRYK
jgi:hypothetical protein